MPMAMVKTDSTAVPLRYEVEVEEAQPPPGCCDFNLGKRLVFLLFSDEG